ncbi:PIN domain-containing protein [Donghicola eburneus]|uniref:HTH domain-containing protein n=1 Tax=Donghicola eburneus TaxID=393278 RepID=UPI0008E9A4F6|nr:hypothetical protein [Donghicola eburneus]SFQ41912.1 hypothetical protein SAMN05421764_103467 [Donghicola eburneus]
MTEFIESKALEQELQSVSRALDVEAGAHKAPLNSLSDSDFELLLWRVFEQQSDPEAYYDKATVMVAGADRGRDVWLTKNGDAVGLIQCKRLKSAFSLPEALREIIKFILFAELDSSLLKDGLPFKYSLAVSTDPAKTTVDFFTSPTQWLEENNGEILALLNTVIGGYESFKDFSGAKILDRVKQKLGSFSYELIRPANIDTLLFGLPRVREQFFQVRLVQSEDAFEELFDRKVDEHGLNREISDKARQLLDEEVQTKINDLRRSRFFPGSDVAKAALRMCKQLKAGEYCQASESVRSNAFGACARWLSRSEEKIAAKEAIELSEALGECDDAVIARAFLPEHTDYTECLKALAPLDNPEKVTAALLSVKHSTDSEQALQWFRDADFASTDLDADGKVVLLSCQLETQNWDEAYSLAISLKQEDFVEAPVLLHFTGMARLLTVLPEEFRDAFRSNVPFVRQQFPLWDDPESMKRRKTASGFFNRAKEAAAEFGLDAKHTYENYALWLELHDPDDDEAAHARLTSLLGDAETAIHYIPLGLGFNLKVDRERIEHVLSRQEARNPGGNFAVALARFVMATSIGDPAEALTYYQTHRKVIETHINPEAYLEFEVQACVQAGRIESAKYAIEKNSEKLSARQKDRFELIIAQGKEGPGIGELEETYSKVPSTANLEHLVEQLGQQGYSDRFFELARKLVVDTRSKTETERVVRFLFANGRYEEVEVVLLEASELVQSSLELRFAAAWTQFRNGNFEEALKAVVQLRNERDDQNDRNLHQNLLIASGRWEELSAFVEEEWKKREHRTPDELHVLAQLSGAIDSPRLGGLLEATAKAGEDDPAILLGCYMTATESGMEDGPEVFGWFDRAFKLSGEDGPVQKKSIEDIANEMPDWNEHVDVVWESYRQGEMPLSMVAAQLRRSSLEMQVSSIVLNQKQSDPRKRSVVSAFSGVRGEVEADLKRIGLESTALVTLASLNVLEDVVRHYDEIHIPHSTLGWLFSERRKLAFHQPSRVKAARALLTALTTGKVHEYTPSLAPEAELATLVDMELAEMLTSAKAEDREAKTIVVRSAPVHKIGSLMDETVDLSDFDTCLCSCQAVIDKLADLGQLMPEDEQQARIFLERNEQRWPDEIQIEDEANLLLDDLSVSYFQKTKLLTNLADAGFKVFVSKSVIQEANTLVELDEHSDDFKRIIEGIRNALSVWMSSGKVRVDKIFNDDDLKSHPNVAALQLAGQVEALVSDDRYLNQFQHAGENDAQTPTLTSLDILASLNQAGVLADDKLDHCRTVLRRAGYVLCPSCPDELARFLGGAQVKNATLVETANLKAFRENVLLTQMRGWLVLTKEMAWFDKLRNDLVSVLVMQWKPGIADDVARTRSRWILRLLDIRNWAGSITENDGSGLAQSGWGIVCNSLALRHLDIDDADASNRYSDWLKEEVFDFLQTSDPEVYEWLIKSLGQMLLSRVGSGGEYDG